MVTSRSILLRMRVFQTNVVVQKINPLNPELNPIRCLLALLGAHHFLHVSRIRVKSLTLRVLMSYIYIYDISTLRVKTHFMFNNCFFSKIVPFMR